MTRQEVPALLILSGAVLATQRVRVGHITLSDRCRRTVGRGKKKNRDVSFLGHAPYGAWAGLIQSMAAGAAGWPPGRASGAPRVHRNRSDPLVLAVSMESRSVSDGPVRALEHKAQREIRDTLQRSGPFAVANRVTVYRRDGGIYLRTTFGVPSRA